MAFSVSDMNREASPASSVRRQRSLQPLGTPTNPGSLPGTPTRRSARLSALHGTSAQQVYQVCCVYSKFW